MRDVDVAVIGSGFGGLTAGALAAASGLSTAIFERHTRPGGCAGDFALEGFWFPAGATVVTGLEPGGILRQVFDKLGVTVESTPIDPSIVFHVESERIGYAADVDEWKRELRQRFAGAERYDRFWDWTHGTGGVVYRLGARLPSLPLQSWSDVRRTTMAVRPETARALPSMFRTVADEIQRLGASGSPPIDAMVDSLLMDATGAPASECSALQGAIALDLYRRGCQWVDGGPAALAMTLVRAARAKGATVSFGCEVTRIRRSGKSWLLTTAEGEVRARCVVANVPPAALAALRGERATPPRERDAWSAVVLHLGIDATGLERLHPYHQVIRGSAENGSSFISIFPSRARPGRWSISVSRHTKPSDWRSEAGELAVRRCSVEHKMLEDVATVIPDVRNRVLVRRSALPATFERYTGRPGGFVGGIVQRRSVVALRAPGHRPAPGLYMAGDHVFPGQGTVGTALSGINAYRDCAESLGLEALL